MSYESEQAIDENQKMILGFIEEYRDVHGHAPSKDEIMLKMGIDSISVVNDYLAQMERAGYIEQNQFGIKLIRPLSSREVLNTDRKLKVFLCHATQDKPIVRELYQRLALEGWIDPWLDKEKLLPGMDVDLEIYKATRDADAIVICLSSISVAKEGYVNKEIRRALDIAQKKTEGTIYIIPLRLDECDPSFEQLKKLHWVDYFPQERLDGAYKRLYKSLELRAKVIGCPIIKLVTQSTTAEKVNEFIIDSHPDKILKQKKPAQKSNCPNLEVVKTIVKKLPVTEYQHKNNSEGDFFGGTAVTKLSYMPPLRAFGSTSDYEENSDIHTYGAVIYENRKVQGKKIVTALTVHGKMFFYDEYLNPLKDGVDARWADTTEPTYNWLSPLEKSYYLEKDIPAGTERELCVVLKHKNEDDCYIFNYETYSQNKLKRPEASLGKGIVLIKIILRGANTESDIEKWFELNNPGIGSDFTFDLIDDPREKIK